jgi:hypothetical protein
MLRGSKYNTWNLEIISKMAASQNNSDKAKWLRILEQQ